MQWAGKARPRGVADPKDSPPSAAHTRQPDLGQRTQLSAWGPQCVGLGHETKFQDDVCELALVRVGSGPGEE